MLISGPVSAPADAAVSSAVAPAGAASPPTASAPPPDLSLVIEDDKAAGEFVYKTVNTVTGAVVSQYPNEQLVRMREDSAYAPGEVIKKFA